MIVPGALRLRVLQTLGRDCKHHLLMYSEPHTGWKLHWPLDMHCTVVTPVGIPITGLPSVQLTLHVVQTGTRERLHAPTFNASFERPGQVVGTVG